MLRTLAAAVLPFALPVHGPAQITAATGPATARPPGPATAIGSGTTAENTTPLSLEAVLQRAAANEPSFAIAAAESRASALERKDARAALLPSATYHNTFLFTESNRTHTTLGTAGGQYVTQAGVEQSLPVFIANNAVHEYSSQGVLSETVGLAQIGAVRLADANALRAEAELEIARRGLVATVVNLFYSLTAGAEKVGIAQRALEEAKRFVDTTEKREAGREAAHADVLKAQLQQQQREREAVDAQLLLRKARLELGVLLFPDPSTPYTLEAAGAPPLLPDRAGIETAARANTAELRSAFAAFRATQAETYTAQAALLPDLGLNFIYGIDAPQFARQGPGGARNLGYSASATLDIPVWDWLTTERKIKEARIRSGAAKAVLTATQRRLVADLEEFYAEAEAAQQQLASFDITIRSAQESLRLTNLRYVDGEGTVLDVVDAQNTLIAAETAQADGRVRYQLALAQLQTLTGKL